MRRNGSNQPNTPWTTEFKGILLDTDFTLKGNGIVPMTSNGKRRNIKKKAINNGWIIGTPSSRKKIGSMIRRNVKPQTLAEMLAYSRPSTQAGKPMKGFFKNNNNSPKVFKMSNGFLRRQVSHTKITQSSKPTLSNVKSTITLKPSQITLSPKYKEYYENTKRKSTNTIEIESPVDNVTATSGASNTLNKGSKNAKSKNTYKNTQGLQGSIYSNSNSIHSKC